jgi:hypothetical protein
MKIKWARGIEVAGIAALLMGVAGGDLLFARNKSGKLDPNGVTNPGNTPVAERNKSGKIDPPQPDMAAPGDAPAVERNKSAKMDPPQPDMAASGGTGSSGAPGTAARNKTGWIIPTIAAVAIAGGVLAASGGGKPKSP